MTESARLSHYDEAGQANMVDVSGKQVTRRTATASAFVELSAAVIQALPENPKGNPLEVARFAGIQAAKRTAELIPMCHPLLLTSVDISFKEEPQPDREGRCAITVTAIAKTSGQTGVEMEAMTAVSVAALTIYDMCKAVDRGISFSDVWLVSKSGGKSGMYQRERGKAQAR